MRVCASYSCCNILSSTACRAAASDALVSSSFWCTSKSTLKSVAVEAAAVTPPPVIPLSTDTPPMEERGGLTGGGVGLGVAGVWGVCGVVGVCGVWGLWEVGLSGLAFGGLGMLTGGKVWGELLCRATTEFCLTGAGVGVEVGQDGLVIEWMSLAGLGAVGGGAGLGETGGGIFFPSTTELEREGKESMAGSLTHICILNSSTHFLICIWVSWSLVMLDVCNSA